MLSFSPLGNCHIVVRHPPNIQQPCFKTLKFSEISKFLTLEPLCIICSPNLLCFHPHLDNCHLVVHLPLNIQQPSFFSSGFSLRPLAFMCMRKSIDSVSICFFPPLPPPFQLLAKFSSFFFRLFRKDDYFFRTYFVVFYIRDLLSACFQFHQTFLFSFYPMFFIFLLLFVFSYIFWFHDQIFRLMRFFIFPLRFSTLLFCYFRFRFAFLHYLITYLHYSLTFCLFFNFFF